MHLNSSIAYFRLILLTLLFTGLSISCKKANKKAQYTIGFSQCVGTDLWRRTMLDEMKTELSLHPGVNFIYSDAQNNSQIQIGQVKKMIDQGIDLLIISPNEAKPLADIVEQAYGKGIPVIVIDRKTSSSLYTAYVGADNYQIGKVAGEYIGSTLKGNVNVLEIMGLPGSSPAIERDKGFNESIKKFDHIHVVTKIYGDWLKTNAESQLVKIKDELKDINAVFAQNDVMAEGARNVLNALDKNKVKVIGVDALPGSGGGLQMVIDKKLIASILYPTGGKEAIVTAFSILNKEQFSRENILQSLVVDSSNVQLMKMQYDRIKSQHRDIEKQQTLLEEQEVVYHSQQIVLNIIVISLVLAIVFGGLAFYWLLENRKINKSLEVKNNEILLQRNQLLDMSAKVEVATEAKLNFFTNITHEFRTPLTLILSSVEDLVPNEKLNSEAGKSLKLIHKNVFRLLRLVNQLIEYRKIEYDKKLLNASPNNIVEFVQDIADSFQSNVQKRNISLNLISKEAKILLWFDINMLDKVFFNLISNAIYFTKDNGLIQIIFSRCDDNTVNIAIQDNGIGMEENDISYVFDHFYQADRADSRGSGLGLSLSKEIIGLHHGHISVTSQKWKGTTFNIKLPVGDQHLQDKEKANQVINTENIIEQSKIYSTDLDRVTPAVKEIFPENPKSHSILVIEDNPDLLAYLNEKFSAFYEVYISDNGVNGLTEAYEKVPDLIIADVVIPGISGRSLAEKLKSDFRTSHIPIILLTAQVSIEHQIAGIETMADLYIIKPFNFDYLLANVKNLINNRILLKEHFTSDTSVVEKIPVSKRLDKKFINDFSGIVEQNLSNENFSVDDICKIIGISRVQLYRKVKALLDCSITEYILNRRLKKAKYLLNNENFTIAEITYRVGISNPNYFATIFKIKYGCTPSEFKKNKLI